MLTTTRPLLTYIPKHERSVRELWFLVLRIYLSGHRCRVLSQRRLQRQLPSLGTTVLGLVSFIGVPDAMAPTDSHPEVLRRILHGLAMPSGFDFPCQILRCAQDDGLAPLTRQDQAMHWRFTTSVFYPGGIQ
jgi:hypothetical protein